MTPTADARPEPHGELWVFGYGSLMWRPGFAYSLKCRATLRGWRRCLCIYSHVYRGTPDRPGLVLGLDRGGACSGVAFRVDAARREATIRYLREREQATEVYIERMAPITLDGGGRVRALTYVADRRHPQYAGRLEREAMLDLVRGGSRANGRQRGLRDRDARPPAGDRRPRPRAGMAQRQTAERAPAEPRQAPRRSRAARRRAAVARSGVTQAAPRSRRSEACYPGPRQILPSQTKPDQTEPRKTKKNQGKKAWISLDSLVRILTFQ